MGTLSEMLAKGHFAHKVGAVLAGSFVVFLQALIEQKESWDFAWIWIVVISGISILACAPLMLMVVKRKGVLETGALRAPSMLLFALWVAGALPATFAKPFTQTGNGYFGSWAALMASFLLVAPENEWVKDRVDKLLSGGGGALVVLAISSFTVCLQTIWSCGAIRGWCDGNAAWILVCSAVSSWLCICLCVQNVARRLKPYMRPLSLFFLIWWSAAIFVTFQAPYDISYANGYFASWAATVASGRFASDTWAFSSSDVVLESVCEVTGGTPAEIVLLFLASLVALIAAAIDCGDVACTGLEAWATICSGASAFVCIVFIFRSMNGGWITESPAVEKLAVVLLAWWILGATSMTFHSPFMQLGNGYLAAWGALASAFAFAAKHVRTCKARIDSTDGHPLAIHWRHVGVLVLASCVLLAQAIWDCTTLSCEFGQIWGIICSVISLLACAAVGFLYSRLEAHLKWIILSVFLWWCVGVSILTFHRTYITTGNGYFACWSACVACYLLMLHQFPQLRGYIDLEALSASGPDDRGTSSLYDVPPAVLGGSSETANGGNAAFDEDNLGSDAHFDFGTATGPDFDFDDAPAPNFHFDHAPAPPPTFRFDDAPRLGDAPPSHFNCNTGPLP